MPNFSMHEEPPKCHQARTTKFKDTIKSNFQHQIEFQTSNQISDYKSSLRLQIKSHITNQVSHYKSNSKHQHQISTSNQIS